jgi:hypothetical protein
LSDVTVAAAQTALDAARAAAARIETVASPATDSSPSLRASPDTDTSGEVDALWPGAPPIDGDARRAQFAGGLVTYDDASDVDHDLIRHATQRVMAMLSQFRAAATASANGKKGELRRMRDEYAALKRDLADKNSRR